MTTNELITGVGGIVSVIIVAWIGRMTARSASKISKEEKFRDELLQRIAQQNDRISATEQREDSLRRNLDELWQRLSKEQTKLRRATEWMREAVYVFDQHNLEPPPIPPDLIS